MFDNNQSNHTEKKFSLCDLVGMKFSRCLRVPDAEFASGSSLVIG